MNKIKVAAVSYLNTKPFLFGLEHSPVLNEIELTTDLPSVIAKQLLNDEVEVGLVPVRVIPVLKEAHIISDYGITCNGAVSSVVICSQLPIEKTEKLFLDYQSRTSAALTQLLIRDYWKLQPEITQSSPGYEKKIEGTTAGLLIGDRALKLKSQFEFCYDLGEAWKNFTSMPFVFACWVSNKKLPDEFNKRFNEAMAYGVHHLDEVILHQQKIYPGVDVKDYLTSKIQFFIDEEKRKALRYFLQLVEEEAKAFVQQR
jgi:chorismate dehydratase